MRRGVKGVKVSVPSTPSWLSKVPGIWKPLGVDWLESESQSLELNINIGVFTQPVPEADI